MRPTVVGGAARLATGLRSYASQTKAAAAVAAIAPLLPAGTERALPANHPSSVPSVPLSPNQAFQAHSLAQLGAADSSGETQELEARVEAILQRHLEEEFRQAASTPSMLNPGPDNTPGDHSGEAVLAGTTSVRSSTRMVASWLSKQTHRRS